jgi:hypothetical protein
MTWPQQMILWAALPLSLSLIVTTVVALRVIIKAQDEENDPAVKQHPR